MIDPLIPLAITLAIFGVIMWIINVYIPMEPVIKRIINIVFIIVIFLWLLRVFGVIPSYPEHIIIR